MPLTEPDGTKPEPLSRLLAIASYRAFKLWRLEPILRGVAMLASAVVLAGLAWVAWCHRQAPFNTLPGFAAASATAALAFRAKHARTRRPGPDHPLSQDAHQILIGISLAIVGWAGCWLHLSVFDRRFLDLGRWTK